MWLALGAGSVPAPSPAWLQPRGNLALPAPLSQTHHPQPRPTGTASPTAPAHSPDTDRPWAQPGCTALTHSSCSPGQPRPASAPPTRPSASSGSGPVRQPSCCRCSAARAGCSCGAPAATWAQGGPGTQPRRLPPPPEPPALHQGCKAGAHLSAEPRSAPQSCPGALEGAVQPPALPRGGQRMLPTAHGPSIAQPQLTCWPGLPSGPCPLGVQAGSRAVPRGPPAPLPGGRSPHPPARRTGGAAREPRPLPRQRQPQLLWCPSCAQTR